jgi:glycosyltransferase involved in cell wall biosynthesis
MNISICFTSFNRTEMLYEAVLPFINDSRISEIIISDDASQIELYNTLNWQYATIEKIKIHRNETNIDCYHNKAKAIELAANDWVAILDSDNIFTKEYIDRLENLWVAGLNDKTIYQPDFAKPHFDFRHIDGINLNKGNIAHFIRDDRTKTMLNAMNYFVNRYEYLKVFDRNINPVTSDSIYQNYQWLLHGNSIYIVPGFEYNHRIHEGSHYQNNVKRTPEGLHNGIIEKFKLMK